MTHIFELNAILDDAINFISNETFRQYSSISIRAFPIAKALKYLTPSKTDLIYKETTVD